MIIVVLCVVIVCRRSCKKKSSDADNQISDRKTELNTVISKTNPVYYAINRDRVDKNVIKQGSNVPVTTNPSYNVSTISSNSKSGEDEYNYAQPYQIKEYSDYVNISTNLCRRLNKSEDRTAGFGAITKNHQSSSSAIPEQRHYVNVYVANTKPTGEDEDSHYYSTVK